MFRSIAVITCILCYYSVYAASCTSTDCTNPVWKSTPGWPASQIIPIGDPTAIVNSNNGAVDVLSKPQCNCAVEFFIVVSPSGGSPGPTPAFISIDQTSGDLSLLGNQATLANEGEKYDIELQAAIDFGSGYVYTTANPIYTVQLRSSCLLHVKNTPTNDPAPSWTNPQQWDIHTTSSAIALTMDNFNALPTYCTYKFAISGDVSWFTLTESNGDISIDASAAKINPDLPNTYSIDISYYVTDSSNLQFFSGTYKLDLRFICSCLDYLQNNQPSPSWVDPQVWDIHHSSSASYTLTMDGFTSFPSHCPYTWGIAGNNGFQTIDTSTGDVTIDATSAKINPDNGSTSTIQIRYYIDDGTGTLTQSGDFKFKMNFICTCLDFIYNNNPNPSWSNPETWYIGDTTSIVKAYDGWSTTPDSGCPIQYFLTVEKPPGTVITSSYFSVDSSTGQFTFNGASSTVAADWGQQYDLELNAGVDDGTGTILDCATPFQFAGKFDSYCYSVPDGTQDTAKIDYSTATLNDVTENVMGNSNAQTVVFDTDVAGILGVANYCGAVKTKLVSPATAPGWLTIDETNNSITVHSTNAADVTGTYSIIIKQILADYEGISDQMAIQPDYTMTVTLQGCQVTSIQLDTVNSYAMYSSGAALGVNTHTTGQTYDFPKYTITPSCIYTTQTMYAKIDGTLFDNTGYTQTVKEGGTAPDNLTWNAWTDDRPTHVGQTYTLEFFVTLDASCVGTCSDQSIGTMQFTWYDICITTAIQAPSTWATEMPSQDTTSELAPAKINTINSYFSNSVAVAQSDDSFCGPYSLSIDSTCASVITLDETNKPTSFDVKFQSTSLSDAATFTQWTTCTLTTTLTNFPTKILTQTFDVEVLECVAAITWDYSGTSTLSDPKTYTIGPDADLVWNYPTYTETPGCNYPFSYTVSIDSGTGTLDTQVPTLSYQMISTTNTAPLKFTVSTADHTLVGTYAISAITATETSTYANTYTLGSSWTLTIASVCETTAWIDPTYANLVAGQETTKTTDITIQDQESINYGNNDGITYCSARIYTVGYKDSSGTTVSQPSFLTLSGTTLTFAPKNTDPLDFWTVEVSACLTDLPTVCSTIYSFTVTIGPCEVASVAWTGTLSDSTHYVWQTGSETFNFPTLTLTPNCAYNQQIDVVMDNGDPMPTFFSINADLLSDFTIYSTDLADIGAYTFKVQMYLTDYPNVYTPDYKTTPDVFGTFIITIAHPCDLTVLDTIHTYADMGPITVLRAEGAEIQYFNEPKDSMSTTWDSTHDPTASLYTWFGLQNDNLVGDSTFITSNPPIYDPVAVGSLLCGARKYTVTGATGAVQCSSFVSVTETVANQPRIEVYGNDNSVVGTHTCSIETTLTNFPAVPMVSVSFQVQIDYCVLTGFSTSDSVTTIQEYILGDSMYKIAFPTYVQVPACGYTLTHTCQSAITDATTVYPGAPTVDYLSAEPVSAPVTNIQGIETCNTAAFQYEVFLNTDTLEGNQLQGDYYIVLTATTNDANSQFLSDSSFTFIMRLINPCIWTTFKSTKNSFTPPTISQLNARILQTPNQVRNIPNFVDYASSTYGNQATPDGYTLCGTRTYTLSPAHAFLTITKNSETSIDIIAHPTLTSEIGYTSFTTPCWTVQVLAQFDNPNYTLAVPQGVGYIDVCIEECMVTSFTPTFTPTTTYTYNIWKDSWPLDDPKQYLQLPHYTQVPACGYPLQFGATIEKFASPSNLVSDPSFAQTALTDTTHWATQTLYDAETADSYIQFFAEGAGPQTASYPDGYLHLYSNRPADNGQYQVIITIDILGQKLTYDYWAYDFSTVSPVVDTYTIDFVDPCETALVNDQNFNSTFWRQPRNMQTAVQGTPDSQNIYEYTDSVSIVFDTVNVIPSNSATGVKICGPRKYSFNPSLAATAWLSFDQANDGLITVTSTTNTEQNYQVSEFDLTINPNQYIGHRVTISSWLQFYPTVRAPDQDFYVTITECVITDFSYDGVMQPSFTYNLYSGLHLEPIVGYTQTPACGYIMSMSLKDTVTLSSPTWNKGYDSTTHSWKIESNNRADAGVYTVVQTAEISFTYMGSPPSNPYLAKTYIGDDTTQPIYAADGITVTGYVQKQFYDMTYTITIVDACVNTVIDQYDGVTQVDPVTLVSTTNPAYFDIAKYNAGTPILKTSVKYGSDLTPLGMAVTLDFPIHSDSVSTLYPVDFATVGRYHACDTRKYTLMKYNPVTLVWDDITATSTFIKLNNLGTDKKQLSVYTALETERSWINPDYDTTTHDLKLIVELDQYLATVTPQVEYFRVEIQSCIVKQIKKNTMGASTQAKLDGYTEAMPWEFYLFYIPTQSVTINSFSLEPACDYVQQNRLEILPDTKPSASLWPYMIASQAASVVPTIVTFYSEEPTLDQGAYDFIDANGIEDKTESTTKNPYHVNVVNYLDVGTFNINSYIHLWGLDTTLTYTEAELRAYDDMAAFGAKNKEVHFWVWPRTPCRKVELIPDDFIYENKTFIYFINDQVKYTAFSPTVTSMQMDANYGNKDVCGQIVYDVVSLNTDDFNALSTVVGTDAPEIATFSLDKSMSGNQFMRVRSSLPYPLDFIKNYGAWTVDAYIIENPVLFNDQYYQIGSREGRYGLATFKLNPDNINFEFKFSLSILRHKDYKVLTEKESEWITFTPGILECGWYTTNNENEGNYTLSLIGTVTDVVTLVQYAIYGNNSFILTVSKEPPPIEIVIEPTLVTPLQDQSVMFGQPLLYKISEGYSEAGYKVTVSADFDLDWLTFSENQFRIVQGKTTVDDIGGYAVKVILKDEIGTTVYLSFMIYIEDDPRRFRVTEDLSALAPVPTIELSEKGLMTINWDKRIKVPRNLTETRNQTVVYYDINIEDIVMKESLEISLVPGTEEPEFQTNFTWDYVSWQNQKIEIQIYFETPLKVGYEAAKDDRAELQVIFYDTYLFVSKATGAQILNYTTPLKGSYNLTVGPQKPVKDVAPPAAELAVLGDVGQVILQLTISYFLNNLWSVIQTQQIIVLIPLFADIFIPDAAKDFFAFMMEIAAFDIVPTDEPFGWVFGLEPPDPISETIDEGGFGTTLFWFNLGSLTFAVISGPFVYVIAKCFKKTGSRNLIKKGVSMERGLFWTSQILILNGSYVIMGICAVINVVNMEWEGYGYAINNLSGLFFFSVCVVFPFFQFYYCTKYFDLLQTPEVKKKFGAMYDGNNLKDKSFVYYNFWFYFRRITLGMVLIIFPTHLFIHMNTLVFQTIVAVIIMGLTKPMEFNQANKMEFFNEIMILNIMYAMMLITNWQYNEEIRDWGGNLMMYGVLIHVVVNLSLMVYNNIDSWRNQWQRYRLLRKNAKSRGQRNRKLQKKKRHARWKAQGKKIQEQKARIKEPSINSQADNYDLRQISYEISEVISSAGLSEPSLIDHRGNIFRQPVEAPATGVANNSVELGMDHGAQKDLGHNLQLGNNMPKEYGPGFESRVHDSIQRRIDEDAILGDPLRMFKQALPQEWNNAGLFRMAPFEEAANQGREEQLLNNKIARMAQQDARIGKANRVKPDEAYGFRGHQVQANTKAIHNKLFQHKDIGEGNYLTQNSFFTPSRRPTIVDDSNSANNLLRKSSKKGGTQTTFKKQLTTKSKQSNQVSYPSRLNSLENSHSVEFDEQESNLARPIEIKSRNIFVPQVKPDPNQPSQEQNPPLLKKPTKPAIEIDDFADFDFGEVDANEKL